MKYVFLLLKVILYPVMLLLNLIIFSRNWLFDKGILKSIQPDVFTINVGNLNLGGTGKTPHVEYLVRLLADKYPTCILSRGYKRKTKGFVLADENATAQIIGDEPMQYFLKFNDKINVVVCEDRVGGVNKIQSILPNNQLVILDDAFQHRKIKPHFNLLLCDFNRPFYDDSLVPIGKLRDLKSSAIRANAVIVTKCPNEISAQKSKEIIDRIKPFVLPETPVFFSKIIYKSITGYTQKSNFDFKKKVSVITAIAKPEIFVTELYRQKIEIEKVQDFSDHFSFSRNEIDKIILDTNHFSKTLQIITTEKDMVKIMPLLTEKEMTHFFYIPIEIEIEDKKSFNSFVLDKIQAFI